MYKTKFCFVRVCVEARTHTITQSTLPVTSTAHTHTTPPFLQKSREVQLTRPNRHSLSRTYTLAAHSDQHCFKQTDTVQSFQRVYTVSRISCKKVNEFLNFNDPSTVSCHLGTKINTFATVPHQLQTRRSASHKQNAGPQRRTRSSRQQAGNNNLH